MTLTMGRSARICRPLREMLQDDHRYSVERDYSPALIMCSDEQAASGLISALSHTDMRVFTIELTANRPHDLSDAAAGDD